MVKATMINKFKIRIILSIFCAVWVKHTDHNFFTIVGKVYFNS